jgi:hypothetical protein
VYQCTHTLDLALLPLHVQPRLIAALIPKPSIPRPKPPGTKRRCTVPESPHRGTPRQRLYMYSVWAEFMVRVRVAARAAGTLQRFDGNCSTKREGRAHREEWHCLHACKKVQAGNGAKVENSKSIAGVVTASPSRPVIPSPAPPYSLHRTFCSVLTRRVLQEADRLFQCTCGQARMHSQRRTGSMFTYNQTPTPK